MEIAAEAPRGNFVIQGITFSIPKPFAAGQVLKENEANVLNQTLAENIRNNLADKIGKLEEAMKADKGADGQPQTPASDEAVTQAGQELVDKYLATYVFGVRRAGGRSLDPVEKEAWDLAETQVKEAIKAMNQKIVAYKDVWDDLVTQALADNPNFMTEAKAIVARRKKATSATISLQLRPKSEEGAAEGGEQPGA